MNDHHPVVIPTHPALSWEMVLFECTSHYLYTCKWEICHLIGFEEEQTFMFSPEIVI